jgi:hypothetical protein
MSKYDDRFEDVYFPDDPRYTFGVNPMPMFEKMKMGSSYEDAVGTLAEGQVRDALDLQEQAGGAAASYVTRIYDQGQEGACTYNAGANAHEVCQARQFGKENVVHLSAISGYKQSGARSPDSGSTVSSCLRVGTNIGFLPLDNPENKAAYPHTMSNTGFYQNYPSGWKDTAKLFTYQEAHVVQTLAGMKTAGARQECLVVGREGHAILYAELVWDDGQYKYIYPNSWSLDWGFAHAGFRGGFGIDTFRQIQKSADWCFVVRTVTARNV